MAVRNSGVVIVMTALLLQASQIATGLRVNLADLRCYSDGKLQPVSPLRLRGGIGASSTHLVFLQQSNACLCSHGYRLVVKVPGRQAADEPAHVEVCLRDAWLLGDRLVLKEVNILTGRKRNILVFGDEDQCQRVRLPFRHILELRFKVHTPCSEQLLGEGPHFDVTFSLKDGPAQCPALPGLPNGQIVPSNRTVFTPGEAVVFQCARNHSLQDPNRWYSVCGPDGLWLQPVPPCVHVDDWCPVVEHFTVANARLHQPPKRSVNSVLRVTCNEGYYLHGLPHYACSEQGQWQSIQKLSNVLCLRRTNCEVPSDPDIIIRGNGILPYQFSYHCCRPGLERYQCGAGTALCEQCMARRCSGGEWSGPSPKCRSVEPLWTRLYNSLFQEVIDMRTSRSNSFVQPCLDQSREELDPLRNEGSSISSACSRSIQDLSGCFDLGFLLDASWSMNDEMFYNISLPFVRIVSKYFSIAPNHTHISVLLFQHISKFLLKQESNSSTFYHTLHNVTRMGLGDTNLREGFEVFTQQVALSLYNGSASSRKKCRKVMFVLSDGEINQGGSPREAASRLKDLDWEIYAIGIGTTHAARNTFKAVASEPVHKYIFSLEYQPPRSAADLGANFFFGNTRRKLPNLEAAVKGIIPGSANYSTCGQTSLPEVVYSGRKRILGGQEARFGAYPWQVALVRKEDGHVICSGSLICAGGCKWVVTAAHCFLDVTRRVRLLDDEVSLRFGENDLTVREGSELECSIKRSVRYPRYSGHPANGNDLMMLLPDCVVELSTRKRCLCLPTDLDSVLYRDDMPAIISGWGAQAGSGMMPSHTLRWARMRLVEQRKCTKNYLITDKMLCSRGEVDTDDTCNGDSGGALVARRPDGSYVGLGVLSYGQVQQGSDAVCGNPGYYSVYTNLLPYIQWIQDTARLYSC